MSDLMPEPADATIVAWFTPNLGILNAVWVRIDRYAESGPDDPRRWFAADNESREAAATWDDLLGRYTKLRGPVVLRPAGQREEAHHAG